MSEASKSDITVRHLDEDEWQVYRDVRLRALRQAPEAFVSSAAKEEGMDEETWRARMSRSSRLVAERDDDVVGVASVGRRPSQTEPIAELFGLWVEPELRGSGVAWKLVDAGVKQAREEDFHFLIYWVGTDNGRGVAFASSFGFRPTDARRPVGDEPGEDGEIEEEMAMIYPLGEDPGAVPNSLVSEG